MSLESLKSNLSSCRRKLSTEKAALNEYKLKVAELDEIYKSMKNKKSDMKDMKKDMSSFSKTDYAYWKGNVFENRYQNKLINELINEKYAKMITIIDNNLDAINNEKTKYENLIYKSKGIIGNLEARINSLVTSIENWLN